MARHFYTIEQDKFLIDNVQGVKYAVLAKMFNEKYGTNINATSIQAKCARLGYKNGIDARMKPGRTPWNKGLKGSVAANSGQFKKGVKSPNYMPIGSETVRRGRVFVKVSDEGKESEQWRPKQEVIWQRHHGPIPEKHLVIFLDGNNRNFNIENLSIISRKTHLRMNQNDMRFKNAELTRTGIKVCELIGNVQEKEKLAKVGHL